MNLSDRQFQQQDLGETVGSAEQLDFLRARACDGIQGYLVSRPVPAEEATRMLAVVAGGGANNSLWTTPPESA